MLTGKVQESLGVQQAACPALLDLLCYAARRGCLCLRPLAPSDRPVYPALPSRASESLIKRRSLVSGDLTERLDLRPTSGSTFGPLRPV